MAELSQDCKHILFGGIEAYIIGRRRPYLLTLHKTGRKTIIAVWEFKESKYECLISTDIKKAFRDWEGEK